MHGIRFEGGVRYRAVEGRTDEPGKGGLEAPSPEPVGRSSKPPEVPAGGAGRGA
jgi:hypothetical protein